jgi:hypothetical protein
MAKKINLELQKAASFVLRWKTVFGKDLENQLVGYISITERHFMG